MLPLGSINSCTGVPYLWLSEGKNLWVDRMAMREGGKANLCPQEHKTIEIEIWIFDLYFIHKFQECN